MLTVAIPKRNKLQNIIVLTPKDGKSRHRGSLPPSGHFHESCGRQALEKQGIQRKSLFL